MKLKKILSVFASFFKIGAFTFGGGYAMIPIIQAEAVEKHGWVTEDDILDIIAIAESTPGPIAINSATFVGYRACGFLGAFAATMGVVLPSFIIILIISYLLREFQNITAVKYAFMGIRAGVLALIIKALWTMYKKAPKSPVSYVVMAAAFVLTAFFDINIIFVIIGCALFGLITSSIAARREKSMIYFELFITFFKIGLFTVGGGYAMLPFIQAEVLAHNWMESADIINFIAISESTPGPFAINISTYVGAELAGILGSCCATLGVVLPSFIIILGVARIYDKFKTSSLVSGCMSGLKPAVVGLIGGAVLNIASTVFIPNGFSNAIFTQAATYISLAIFALSTYLTFKKKTHPIVLILIAAALGIIAGYLFKI